MNVGKVSLGSSVIGAVVWCGNNLSYQENAGTVYRSFMTQHGEVEIDADGWGSFSCFANHVQVWVKGF